MSPSLTIVICTKDRGRLLVTCLNSILASKTQFPFYVLIVDNNSQDDTKTICDKYVLEYSNITYLKEEKIGLSLVKNTAIETVKTQWIFFIDDDGKVQNDFIERLFQRILNNNIEMIGGRYIPWFENEPPKWLPKDFGRMRLLRKSFGKLNKGFLSGGVMGFNLESIGNLRFPTEFGMKGRKIGYGEEVVFQIQFKKRGGEIYFDPKLILEHLVPKYKMKKAWHFKSSYKQGITHIKAINTTKIGFKDFFYLMKKMILHILLFEFVTFNHLKKRSWDFGNIIGAIHLLIKR